MKTQLIAVLGTAAALLLAGTLAATAQPDRPRLPGDRQPGDRPRLPGEGPGPADQPGFPGRDREAHGDFEDHMSGAGLAMRRLRRALGEELGEGSNAAGAIQRLQSELVGAKGQTETAPMSDAARAEYGEDAVAFRRDLRLGLIEALEESLVLEAAILKADADGANASLAKLRAIQREHHALFQPEDEDDQDDPRRPGQPRPRGGPGGG